MVGPFGLSKTVLRNSKTMSNLQTGNFYDYALWMFLGLLSMLILVEFWELMMIIVDPSLVAIFFITTLFSIKTL
jgi:hypothetical protein